MMMLMLAIGAWAGEVTDVLTGAATGVTGSSYTDWSGVTLTSDAVYAGQSAGTYGSIQLRSKNNNSGVITTVSGGKVKSVTVEFNSNTMDGRTLNFYGKNTAYSAPTDLYDGSLQGELLGTFVKGGETSSVTVEGDYEYIGFRSAADAMYIESITIVWDTEGSAPAVATPVIAGETPFTESTEVTITCATDGASIYYTTDGSEPTSQSTAYTAAFSITETTTVKAIAYDATGAASSVATKTFEKEEGPASCATVAEINALEDNTEFTFTGRLVVSGHAHATSGTNNWLYAQDATGGTLLFKATQDYQKNDVIPAGFTGTKATYGGVAQVQSLANMQPATETEELVAEELTPSQISSENVYRYAVIKGATVNGNNIVVGEESVVIYNNRFNTEIPADEKTYDVYGITSSFNGTPQFMPLEFVAQATEVATPVIEGETPFLESTQVTITCETAGASIYYTTDGSEPTNQSTAYTAPFSLTESATVKAIAYDATGAASAVATKAFEKQITCATVAEINALADNTEFTFTGRLVVSGHAHATSGANNWLYAQDATGGTLMFKATQDYQKDDVIPAGFTGTKATYGGVAQVQSLANMQPATETEELVAEELTPSQISSENVYRYAVIKGATVNGNNIVVGEESVVIYNNRFNTEIPADEKTYDVYGITSSFNGTPQFMPLEFVEVVEKTETPTIACLEGETEYTFIVNGLGELKLYANGVEVEIPYIVTRTSEDQVITLVATAQEEGKEISDPREWTVTVPKLEVVEIEELYVVGDFNGWSTTEGVVELVENESNEFVGTVEFEANGEFKLITPNPDVTATTGWIWFGGQDDNGVDYFEINEGLLDHEISLVNGANFRVVDAGEYTITVKEAAVVPGGKGVQEPLVMIVTKNAPQAIETIGSENVSAVRYYNLQGVESATPFEGVNIVVRMMNDGTKSVSKMVK